MKKISIVVPCFNEEENVVPISNAIINELNKLDTYEYELIFIDNSSTDNTRNLIEELCVLNKKIKAIFNAKNFGQFNSPYYGMLQAEGDCVILIAADFQDPVELIGNFIKEWENGYKIVSAIKHSSKENRIMRFLRSCYYKVIKKMSDVEQIEHFTGFGLYDKSFIEVLRKLDDPTPFLRGIVAELGYDRKDIFYEQAKRRAGKTSNNFFSLYDASMLSFTSYTKTGLRFATFFGAIISSLSMVIGLVYLILKLVFWDNFSAGTAPILIGIFFLGSIQVFFIGFIGEYIMAINTRMMKRPLVIEEKRINFQERNKYEKQNN
ncbi:MAG: glycosyltransferase family 2 protein [Fusobacteria bacterium]|nr:glycosyltransferase family 2 protein [Fusobacteriota bacterium]